MDEIKIGDVVTRDGTDEHLVFGINDPACDLIDVVCIKNPKSGWTKISETESNLTRRYTSLYRHVNYMDKLKMIVQLEDIDKDDKDFIMQSWQ